MKGQGRRETCNESARDGWVCVPPGLKARQWLKERGLYPWGQLVLDG